ncbi:flavodoxin family protein [Vreelandella populi]|uniref:Flavodoxin family protein n=1 Tax=Vreelandella populi TaxID=2498858 RepID=A0A433LHC5_9GAMM|nr:flavodoxin family protein [Halomonas populi]RUR40948.1 flavodoxin family protein [Halomonas populi]RUR49460.1 flavodoxin family protein [Halomonas populi]RUR55943.1 flavodoxin family protein [Halomonas populi]
MTESKKLLIIAHAPSENTQKMWKAVMDGASNSDIENVQVQSLPPLQTQPEDIIAADAIILGTTENLGYMAGLMKDVFDRCYYPCLDKTEGLPFAFYIRAGHDGTGTRRAIESITKGLRWRLVQDPLICRGDFQAAFLDHCEELGLAMAASLEAGII